MPRREPLSGISALTSLGATRCAVVGSAGTLQCQEHGAEIDAHSLVMRANGASAGGPYAAIAGRRTDVAFLRWSHANDTTWQVRRLCERHVVPRMLVIGLPLPANKHRQVSQRVQSASEREFGRALHACRLRNKEVQLVELPASVFGVLERVKMRLIAAAPATLCSGFSLTTGFVMAITAALACRQVTLYGFTPPAAAEAPPRATRRCDRGEGGRYSYYSERAPWASAMSNDSATSHVLWAATRDGGVLQGRHRHFFELEAQLLHEWARASKLYYAPRLQGSTMSRTARRHLCSR